MPKGYSSSWSSSGGTYNPNPGGTSGKADPENVLGPRIPATLKEALGEKGAPMSPAKASSGTNPHYSTEYEAYQSNCQRCVLAYEARRRGYNVTALPTYSGDLLPYGRDYLKGLSNPKTIDLGKSKLKLEKQMGSFGSGARAIVHVSKGMNGHVFIAENRNGKISYIDPQVNKRYSNINLSHVSGVQVTRIDNQSFTEYARNAFTTQKV